MVRRLALIFSTLVLLVGCGSNTAAPSGSARAAADAVSVGRAFVSALSRGDDSGAQAMEDAAMLAAAPSARLGQLWQQVVAQYGAFQSIGSVTITSQAPYTIAIVPVTFSSDTATLTVAVTSGGRVAGLHVGKVVPGSPASPATPPSVFLQGRLRQGRPD